MNRNELYEKYAKVLVESGVNIQKNQPVQIRIPLYPECLEFAKYLVEHCYKRGASYVKVKYMNGYIDKICINNSSYEVLEEIPDYRIDELKYDQNHNICSISITSFDPDAMKGIDPKKMRAGNVAFQKKAGRDIMNYFGSNKGQWCIAGFPNVKWAKLIYPELSDDEAFDKLFLKILETSHVTIDNDPVEEWYQHNKTIQKHCAILNEYNFKELHYKNSLGTNLIIKLPVGHIWCGGCEETNNEKKISFNPNMPTEEVFTCPQRDGINGIVYASKPLVYGGNIIKDFYIKFVNGEIVDYDAKEGKEYLKAIIDSDEGSKYLGEVALVPYHSPISMSNILFYSTLFDENASCHLAIGAAYETTVKNTDGKSEEELKKMGINDSAVHVDFMVGTSDMEIVGITYNNQQIPVFIKGDFAF